MGSIPTQKSLHAGTTYTIRSGDNFSAIADRLGLDLRALLAANPGVMPEGLEVGQVIDLPAKSTGHESGSQPVLGDGGQFPGERGGSHGGGDYINYSGPASSFPDPVNWASYSALWTQNARLMKFNDSDSEIALIKSSIERVAEESGVDVRVILCIIVQESGGNVRVNSTANGVNNPGLMQSHNGVSFNPSDPAGSILQMVRDGTEGTKDGDGLKQCFAHQNNWYGAFREYNSGSVNQADMNDARGATGSYVRDAANRLMGHVWPNM